MVLGGTAHSLWENLKNASKITCSIKTVPEKKKEKKNCNNFFRKAGFKDLESTYFLNLHLVVINNENLWIF